MSAVMKNQIKDMVESVEKHETQMKHILQQVQGMNLDGLLKQVSEVGSNLGQKVSLKDFEQLELKLVKDLLQCKS